MGLYASKPEDTNTMEEGRESPSSGEDQQTTSEDSSESASVRESDTPESINNSGDAQRAVVLFEGDLREDFSEAIEPFFTRAEKQISDERFDFSAAKKLVLVLRDLGQRYEAKGCTEASLEETVLTRALETVYQLMDGVNLNQEEVYDPRQTMVYLYCAIAVFPCTVRLERNAQGILQFRFSTKGAHCPPQLEELNRFCALKTGCEGANGLTNHLQHQRMLLDLAAWREVDMPPAAYMISFKSLQVLGALIARIRGMAHLPGMSTVIEKMERLWDMNVVVAASSLVREGLFREAKDYHRWLSRVDTNRLPPFLATRHAYVYACLLNNCREFAKALTIARDAVTGVTDPEERRKFEQLISEINDALETASQRTNSQGPADPQWLEGTCALTNQGRTDAQEAARQSHLAQAKHRRVRTVSVGRRGRTPSPAPLSRQSGVAAQGTFRGGRNRSSSFCHPSNHNFSLYTQPARVSTCSAGDLSQGASGPTASPSLCENILYGSDLDDDSDDYEEDVYYADEEVRFHHLDDQDTEYIAEESSTVEILTVEDEDEGQNWFEKSEEGLNNGEIEEREEEGERIELSEQQKEYFNKGGRGYVFYPALFLNAEAEHLLRSEPTKYVRCQIKIERAHKSIAKVLDSKCRYTDILIDGRSKANQTFMDDEVVVQITAEPGKTKSLKQGRGAGPAGPNNSVEKMPHGKVVGLLNRVNYSDVDHPVMFCTLDEKEGHLMKPLCKTVPKIHVLNDLVRKKFPALKKNRIDLKTISPDGEIVHKEFLNVQPDKREQYVFKVAILAWRPQNIYPLGAVLSWHIGGRDYAGGLRVLSMQQRVPRCYPRTAVESTTLLLQQSLSKKDRLDLTKQRLFTIDPPGSKDLDDAVSIQKKGTHYVIGVHIADVAAQVPKDSGVDQEARKRAVTFYPLNRRPHAMLPEPLSHGKCSLLQDQERLALSAFFMFNEKGKQVKEPVIRKTVIRSLRQLTYAEAQKAIDGEHVDVDPLVQEDIRELHKITRILKEMRQKNSMLFVPFEDPRLQELERINEHIDAHSLIEELMILANTTVAKYLTKLPRYRDVMLVRCHKAPTWEELAEWRDTEGSVTNLVMQLQGKSVTPSGTQLSFNANDIAAGAAQQRQNVVVQKEVWKQLCRYIEEGDMTEARRLAFMDALHPLQCLANCRWMDLMERAQYRCFSGLNGSERRHFGLDLDVYTHFTSPIRRYADVYIQRLLHAALESSAPDTNPDDVTALCQHINSATSRQRAFGKGCMSLKVSEGLQRQPLVFRAYVDKVDDEQLTVCVPSLLKVPDRRQELPFSMLGVSSQPELVTDTALRKDTVTVQWTKRIYDVSQTCPRSLMSHRKQLEKSKNRSANAPIKMTLRPDMNSVAVKHQDWATILQTLTSSAEGFEMLVPEPVERGQSEVEYMSSEKRDGSVSLLPLKFVRQYTRGQVVQIQMSAEPRKGMLQPRVEMLHTARNASVCTQHVTDPIQALTHFAARATKGQNFSNYKDYVQAWMPLLEMEAAVGAADGDGGVVIDNVTVTMKAQGPSNSLKYRGFFSLNAAFCYDRCIDFGGKSPSSIGKDEVKKDNSFPLDYLCLRYKMECSDIIASRVQSSGIPETVDKQFTWLAHASVVDVIHRGRKSEDGGELVVTFVLSPSSPRPPSQLMARDGAKLTLEVLPKSDVDRRAQQMLIQLNDTECELARAIAFGRQIPKLEHDHRRLGKKDENHEVYVESSTEKLLNNNTRQLEAIKLAMTKSLAVIQGPPGTGKTNVGIKLVYLFSKVNRQLEAEGKGKKTVVYCGPSNKSVDLVAKGLLRKLGDKCPKIVRMYGSSIEDKDYPVPRGNLRSKRGMRDLTSDPNLEDVSLHHLIRREGKPKAEEIAVFQRYFDKCNAMPDVYSVTSKQLKKYRKLVYDASVEELSHYEVVLATCAVGGNNKLTSGTQGTVYQVIIDECAMCPEPASLVPVVANNAKQLVLIGDHKQLRPIIQCGAAADLGLDQSLFERLHDKFYNEHTAFLDTQYRMHPEICAFPSKEFYENQLKTAPSFWWKAWYRMNCWRNYPPGSENPIPHVLVDIRGEEETLTVNTEEGNERSKSNSMEAEKVIEILIYLRKCRVELSNVKVLTQYNAQRHLLETKLKTAIQNNGENAFNHYDRINMQNVSVSTVVSSQGGEWDYVILSTVRSLPGYMIEPNPTHGWCIQNLGFITDRNQVNVALTRARKGLFIVGNAQLLRCDEVWKHLLERYERMGCLIQDASTFPPPLPTRRKKGRRVQNNARDEWQNVEISRPNREEGDSQQPSAP